MIPILKAVVWLATRDLLLGPKLLIPRAYFTGKIHSPVKPTSSFLGLAFRKGSKPGNLGWTLKMDFAYKILASSATQYAPTQQEILSYNLLYKTNIFQFIAIV